MVLFTKSVYNNGTGKFHVYGLSIIPYIIYSSYKQGGKASF